MIKERLLPQITLALVFAIACLPACSSNTSDGNPMTMADAGTDQGQTQDTGGGGTTCPSRDDLAAATPTCTTLANTAQAISYTALTGSAPVPAGGAIQDGLYVSTRTGSYGATTTPSGRRITFVITDHATRMLWSGDVLDANGGVAVSFRADTAISVSGTRMTFTVTCATQGAPLPTALDFTVSGQDLVLSLANGATVAETRYTRMGCAP